VGMNDQAKDSAAIAFSNVGKSYRPMFAVCVRCPT
jgi:hypothetical protein